MAISIFVLVLVLGPTTFILKSYIQNIGSYLTHFIEMSTWTESLRNSEWQKSAPLCTGAGGFLGRPL